MHSCKKCFCILERNIGCIDFHLSSASQHKSLGHFIVIAEETESNGKMVTVWPSYPVILSNCQARSGLLTLNKHYTNRNNSTEWSQTECMGS